jgi:hypothetical protein
LFRLHRKRIVVDFFLKYAHFKRTISFSCERELIVVAVGCFNFAAFAPAGGTGSVVRICRSCAAAWYHGAGSDT